MSNTEQRADSACWLVSDQRGDVSGADVTRPRAHSPHGLPVS